VARTSPQVARIVTRQRVRPMSCLLDREGYQVAETPIVFEQPESTPSESTPSESTLSDSTLLESNLTAGVDKTSDTAVLQSDANSENNMETPVRKSSNVDHDTVDNISADSATVDNTSTEAATAAVTATAADIKSVSGGVILRNKGNTDPSVINRRRHQAELMEERRRTFGGYCANDMVMYRMLASDAELSSRSESLCSIKASDMSLEAQRKQTERELEDAAKERRRRLGLMTLSMDWGSTHGSKLPFHRIHMKPVKRVSIPNVFATSTSTSSCESAASATSPSTLRQRSDIASLQKLKSSSVENLIDKLSALEGRLSKSHSAAKRLRFRTNGQAESVGALLRTRSQEIVGGSTRVRYDWLI